MVQTEIGLLIKNLGSTKIPSLAKTTKLVNMRQILDPEYLGANSPTIESIVDGKSLVGSRTHLLTSIGIFCLFIETISNEKNVERASMNRCCISTVTCFQHPKKKSAKKASLK
jgi:hypothetical protein